jgi:uncharacterized protein YndB with AHSA1/START domain
MPELVYRAHTEPAIIQQWLLGPDGWTMPIVHIERMHLPDPTPDNEVETRFEPDGTGTLMTMRMALPDAKTREAMLKTGMEDGMEASYQRLEKLL